MIKQIDFPSKGCVCVCVIAYTCVPFIKLHTEQQQQKQRKTQTYVRMVDDTSDPLVLKTAIML